MGLRKWYEVSVDRSFPTGVHTHMSYMYVYTTYTVWLMVVFEHVFKGILSVLYKTFWNLISIEMRYDCHVYIGKISNRFENIYRSCETFNANIYLVENSYTSRSYSILTSLKILWFINKNRTFKYFLRNI